MSARNSATVAMCVFAMLAASGRADESPAPDATTNGAEQTDDEPSLLSLVESYFKEPGARERRKIAVDITSREDATPDAVAEAIHTAQLWEEKQPGVERFVIPTARDRELTEPIEVRVRVPEGYDANTAYPLVLALPDGNQDADALIQQTSDLLSRRADNVLIGAVIGMPQVALTSPQETIDERTALLRAFRHRYHVDANRVYVIGKGLGGHAAVTWAALEPDHFAGVLAIDGTLTLQLPGEPAGLFIANLRPVHTILVYDGRCENDNQSTGRKTGDQATNPTPAADETERPGDNRCEIAAWNRYIASIADRDGLPVRAIEIDTDSPGSLNVPADAIDELLGCTRSDNAHEVSLLFRYPEQGSIGWLRQTRFLGEPWTAQAIQVAAAPAESNGETLRAVLSDKLAYIGGTIEGQTVTLTTRRTEKVELRLNGRLIDLGEDITIILNDTKRYEGRAEPSIRTMLETAQADWDFQNPWPVRFQIDDKGRAIQK